MNISIASSTNMSFIWFHTCELGCFLLFGAIFCSFFNLYGRQDVWKKPRQKVTSLLGKTTAVCLLGGPPKWLIYCPSVLVVVFDLSFWILSPFMIWASSFPVNQLLDRVRLHSIYSWGISQLTGVSRELRFPDTNRQLEYTLLNPNWILPYLAVSHEIGLLMLIFSSPRAPAKFSSCSSVIIIVFLIVGEGPDY